MSSDRKGPDFGVCLQQHGNAVRSRVELRQREQICVRRERGGPGVVYACEPVPSGCESDRSCDCVRAALCPFDTCGDEGPNAISCVCERCV